MIVHRLTSYCVFASVLLSAAVARADFSPIAGWGSQVFPSYLISTAAMKNDTEQQQNTLGDGFGAFGVEVTATAAKQPIKVTITCEGFAESSEFVGVLPEAGQSYRVLPKMKYKFDKLAACKQAIPTTVTYRVQLGRSTVEEQTLTITMRSINDCPFALVSGEDVTEMNLCFAAYVNEQHPFVDKMLRDALSIGMVRSFTGYQSKDPREVLAQVYAIWDLMVARDMRYSSITTTAALSAETYSQHVRMLEETINNTQANCVDGSVLMASILRKVGIDAALIVTADHCYLAFWADQEHKLLYGLETTLVSADMVGEDVPTHYDEAVPEDIRWDYSWASFAHAMQTGTANLQKEIDKETQEISVINVADARMMGVLPIPYQGNDEFLATTIDYLEDEEEYTEEMDSEAEADVESNEEEATPDIVEWDDEVEEPVTPVRKKKKAAETIEWE